MFAGHVAWSFLAAMGSFGHHEVFNWGNDDAWSTDFEHPDFGGDSLNWSDNVHFCHFVGHGNQTTLKGNPVQRLAFSSNLTPHTPPAFIPCCTLSVKWRLGVRQLKWFVMDSCEVVQNTNADHVVSRWAEPMQGIHLLFGFVGRPKFSQYTYRRRVSFAFDICRGKPLANSWLDTAYSWEHPDLPPNIPIAIAAGASRDEAINRREYETLDWAIFDVVSTNWLAWKHRR
jgi:hypothetical protein